MTDLVAANLAKNIKQLREARNLTQDQLAKLSDIPRPTLANLESGESNPTLSVLVKVAGAFQISVEALISPPRSTTQFYPSDSISVHKRNDVRVRSVLPDKFGSLEIDRMEFEPGARMVGMPHKNGTREYLFCELGQIELSVAGEIWKLSQGDVVVFRGDQRHSYFNNTLEKSIGHSIILIGPILI